jgi:hypothetical protein
VYFGAAGMSDFLHHKNEERKNRYILIMKKMRIGPRAALIAPDFGVGGYCGTNHN